MHLMQDSELGAVLQLSHKHGFKMVQVADPRYFSLQMEPFLKRTGPTTQDGMLVFYVY